MGRRICLGEMKRLQNNHLGCAKALPWGKEVFVSVLVGPKCFGRMTEAMKDWEATAVCGIKVKNSFATPTSWGFFSVLPSLPLALRDINMLEQCKS